MRNGNARLLIAGSYGHGNTGDEAILSTIVSHLRAKIPYVRLVVVAGDTEAVSRQHGVETVSWADWAAIAQAVQNSDAVIQGGGGIFFDYTDFHPWNLFENNAPDLAHYGGFSLLATLYRKPFMVYGVGVGPLFTESGRKLVRVVHSLAHKITVRDVESKAVLEGIGVGSDRVEVTTDPAFCIKPADANEARRILGDHGINFERPVIAITPRPWDYSQPGWEDQLSEALSPFASAKQAQILLIPFHKGYDDVTVLRVQQLLANNETFTLRSEYTPQEIAGVIGVCDLLIGMRLHSILFAILTATPAVALSYDPKVRSLTRRIGHEEICVDLTDLGRLSDLLAGVWDRREELSIDFRKAAAGQRVLSERNAAVACELLSNEVSDLVLDSESSDMLAEAFYGRLHGIRVRDYVIANDDRTELREILRILEAENSTKPPMPPGTLESNELQPLRDFLQKQDIASPAHVLVIYKSGSLADGARILAESFAGSDIPVVLVCENEQTASRADAVAGGGRLFQLPVASMVRSWDEVLRIPTSRNRQRILVLTSADENTFRLINHAHAMDWATIYYPTSRDQRDSHDSDAEKYVVNNVEYVIVDSESLKDEMKSLGVQEVITLGNSQSGNNQVAEILTLTADTLPRSPVRLAIKGASHG